MFNSKSVTVLFRAALILGAIVLSACTAERHGGNPSYLASGSIILSRQLPQNTPVQVPPLAMRDGQQLMAPLIGYIPPTIGFLPAENEAWLEVEKATKSVALYIGKELKKSVQAEGSISLAPGTYALQHKQKSAAWYAPDSYFQKRQLSVPAASDRSRYRRGALGQFVLFPTTTFAIHSGPVWNEDVGGLRVAQSDLSSIFFALPLGATIVVK